MKTTTQAEERGTTATPAIASQLNRSAAGAAALGAVFTLPVAVDAAVVYVSGVPVTATLPASQRHASNNTTDANAATYGFLDIDGNGGTDFALRVRQQGPNSFGDIHGRADLLAVSGNGVAFFGGGEGGGDAINFSGSNFVGTGQQGFQQYGLLRFYSLFSGTDARTDGYFAAGVTGVAGVQFQRPGSTSSAPSTTHYGWVRLLVEDGPGGFPYQVTAIEWAWETTPDTAIHVPGGEPIPEANPGLILLAAGGTGLAAWRMRRRQAAKAAAQA